MIPRLHFRRRSGLARSLSSVVAAVLLLVASAYLAHQHGDPSLAGDDGQRCELCIQVGTPSPAPAADLVSRVTPIVTRAPQLRSIEPAARLIVHAYLSRGPPSA